MAKREKRKSGNIEKIRKAAANLRNKLLRSDRHAYNQMMAELARQGEPASAEEQPKRDPCPDCGQRRPAPTSGQYEGTSMSKRQVEGRRSARLGTPQKRSMAGTLDEAWKDHVALELLDSEVQSVREKLGSDIEEEDDIPSCSVRNPTGPKRSTDLTPLSVRSPEELLSEKQQKSLKGEETD